MEYIPSHAFRESHKNLESLKYAEDRISLIFVLLLLVTKW